MRKERKIVPDSERARAANIAHLPGVDGKRATAANLARPQALTYGNSIPRPPFHLKQRQLFEAARDGRVWVVDRLLRKSSVKTQDTHGTLDINFQYSAKVAGKGGSFLWPWYWCIDVRDALAFCWGAPPGTEPETGDTLLMISIKSGMEELTRRLLRHQDINTGINNSSGRHAASIAVRCGRESLSFRMPARQNPNQRHGRGAQKSVGRTRARQRKRRRGHVKTRRAPAAGTFGETNSVMSSSENISVDCGSALFGHTASDLVDCGEQNSQRSGGRGTPERKAGDVSENQIVTAAGLDGSSTSGQKSESAASHDKPTATSDDERKKNVAGPELCNTASDNNSRNNGTVVNRRPSSSSRQLRALPQDTRTVAVQTEVKLLHTQETTRLLQTTNTDSGAESNAFLSEGACECHSSGDILLRPSTAPIDAARNPVLCESCDPTARAVVRSPKVNAEPDAVDGVVLLQKDNDDDIDKVPEQLRSRFAKANGGTSGSNDNGWLVGNDADDTTSAHVKTAGVERCDRTRIEQTDNASEANLTISRADDKSGATIDFPNGDECTLKDRQGACSVQNEPILLGRDYSSAVGETSPFDTTTFVKRRSKVDEVTQDLQALLREDALQEDGSMDYEATFELFDVNGDGNVGADELHSVFVSLGMGNLLPEEEISTIVRRVPTDLSGQITKNELQVFAELPEDFPWPSKRGSADSQVRANGSEEASAIAVVLHELQVNEAAPAAGMFSWKKTPTDHSSVSLLVRITRGFHAAESTVKLPHSLPFDRDRGGGGGGGGGSSKIKNKGVLWSWQWNQTLTLPRPPTAPPAVLPLCSTLESLQAGNYETVRPRDDRKRDSGLKGTRLADPLVVVVARTEEVRDLEKSTTTNNIASSEQSAHATTTREAVVAADEAQGTGEFSGESDFGNSEKKEPTKVETSASAAEIIANNADNSVVGGSIGNTVKATSTRVHKKRLSFWSPKKGRRERRNRTHNCNGSEHGSDVCSTDDGETSNDSDVSHSNKRSTLVDARPLTVVSLASVGDLGVDGVIVKDIACTAALGGGRKKLASFWSPEREYKAQNENPHEASSSKHGSDVSTKDDHETSTDSDVSVRTKSSTVENTVPSEILSAKTADAKGVAEPIADCFPIKTASGTARKKGLPFWRKETGRRKHGGNATQNTVEGKHGGSDVDSKGVDEPDADGSAGDDFASETFLANERSDSATSGDSDVSSPKRGCKTVKTALPPAYVSAEIGKTVADDRSIDHSVAEANPVPGGVGKKGVPFWNPGRGRRSRDNKNGNAVNGKRGSGGVGSKGDGDTVSDSDASIAENGFKAMGTQEQPAHSSRTTREAASGGDPVAAGATEAGNFSSPRRKSFWSRGKGHPQNSNNHDSFLGKRVGDVDSPGSTVPQRASDHSQEFVTNEKRGRPRRRALPNLFAARDVLLIEVWEVKDPAVPKLSPTLDHTSLERSPTRRQGQRTPDGHHEETKSYTSPPLVVVEDTVQSDSDDDLSLESEVSVSTARSSGSRAPLSFPIKARRNTKSAPLPASQTPTSEPQPTSALRRRLSVVPGEEADTPNGHNKVGKQAPNFHESKLKFQPQSPPTTNIAAQPAVVWGQLTIPVAEVLSTGNGKNTGKKEKLEGSAQHAPVVDIDGEHKNGGNFGSRSSTGGKNSRRGTMFGINIARRSPKQAEDDPVDGVGGKESGLGVRQLSEVAPRCSVVVGWFDVSCPKGKRRAAKGRVRLTLSCVETAAPPEARRGKRPSIAGLRQ